MRLVNRVGNMYGWLIIGVVTVAISVKRVSSSLNYVILLK